MKTRQVTTKKPFHRGCKYPDTENICLRRPVFRDRAMRTKQKQEEF